MSDLKTIFASSGYKASAFRPLGAGLTLAIPLFMGIILKDSMISSVGVMGSFAYLIFQETSFMSNLKAISLHGLLLFVSFTIGTLSALYPWSVPFVIAVLSFVGFIFSKVYQVPKPDYFFVIMIYVTGATMMPTTDFLKTPLYTLYGVFGAIVTGMLISLLIGLPFKESKPKKNVSFSQRYQETLNKQPEIVTKAIYFSMILFFSAYVSYLLKDVNGQWVLISSAAILAAEKLDKIKIRSIQRVIGSIVGLLLGSLLIRLDLPMLVIFMLLIVFSMCIEYFMPRNYVVANFFTNPQVLLITSMTADSYNFVSHRVSGILLGTIIVIVLVMIEDYGMNLLLKNKKDAE